MKRSLEASRPVAVERGRVVDLPPLVSVVIPSYNTAGFIAATLDSVFAQTYHEVFEVIVVNDGSPDHEALEAVLAGYADRINYVAQENRGLAGARNRGIRAARGRYVAFLDSDDLWEPGYLEELAAALDADPGLDVVFPNVVIFGDTPEAGRTFSDTHEMGRPITFESLLAGDSCISAGAMVRRAALERHGMFDDSLRSVEDFDLWLRMLHAGDRIGYVPRVLIRYRRWKGSLSADPTWMFTTQLRVFEKLAATLALTPRQREVLGRRVEATRAKLKMAEGKRAFFRGEPEDAVRSLLEANTVLRSRKIALAALVMRIAPRMLLHGYRLRDRLVFRANTQY